MTTTEATPRLLAAGRRLEIAGQKFSRLTAIERRIDIGWSHEKAITIPVMPGVPLRSRE